MPDYLRLSLFLQRLCPDDVLLAVPRIETEARFHVIAVNLNEIGECHGHVIMLLKLECPLPFHRVLLLLKAPLCLLFTLAGPVLVISSDFPFSCLFILDHCLGSVLFCGASVKYFLKILTADSTSYRVIPLGNHLVIQLADDLVCHAVRNTKNLLKICCRSFRILLYACFRCFQFIYELFSCSYPNSSFLNCQYILAENITFLHCF